MSALSSLAAAERDDRRPGSAGVLAGVVLSLLAILPTMGAVLIVPVLPLFARAFAGVPAIGIIAPVILTLPALCSGLLSPFAGAAADRFGRRRLLIGALVVYGLAGTAPALLDSIPLIIATRFVVGVSEAVIMTCCTTLVGDYFSGAVRERWLSYQSAVVAVGATMLFVIGGALGAFGAVFGVRGGISAGPAVDVGVARAAGKPASRRRPSLSLEAVSRLHRAGGVRRDRLLCRAGPDRLHRGRHRERFAADHRSARGTAKPRRRARLRVVPLRQPLRQPQDHDRSGSRCGLRFSDDRARRVAAADGVRARGRWSRDGFAAADPARDGDDALALRVARPGHGDSSANSSARSSSRRCRRERANSSARSVSSATPASLPRSLRPRCSIATAAGVRTPAHDPALRECPDAAPQPMASPLDPHRRRPEVRWPIKRCS